MMISDTQLTAWLSAFVRRRRNMADLQLLLDSTFYIDAGRLWHLFRLSESSDPTHLGKRDRENIQLLGTFLIRAGQFLQSKLEIE